MCFIYATSGRALFAFLSCKPGKSSSGAQSASADPQTSAPESAAVISLVATNINLNGRQKLVALHTRHSYKDERPWVIELSIEYPGNL